MPNGEFPEFAGQFHGFKAKAGVKAKTSRKRVCQNPRGSSCPATTSPTQLTGELHYQLCRRLSEGVFWNFKRQAIEVSRPLLDYYGIDPARFAADRCGSIPCAVHGPPHGPRRREVLGLAAGHCPSATGRATSPTMPSRLNVLNPGEVAATAGTSGVSLRHQRDNWPPTRSSRVNAFVPMSISTAANAPRQRRAACASTARAFSTAGCGVWWAALAAPTSELNANCACAKPPVGAGGLSFLPFGNGAERILENRASRQLSFQNGMQFNIHTAANMWCGPRKRASCLRLLNYGMDIMRANAGVQVQQWCGRAHANMFLSPVFSAKLSCQRGQPHPRTLYHTDAAAWARPVGAGIGAGIVFAECLPKPSARLELLPNPLSQRRMLTRRNTKRPIQDWRDPAGPSEMRQAAL